MFSKKRQMQPPFFQPTGSFDPNLMPPDPSFSPMGGYDLLRLRTEVQENRRMINDLLRRVIRLENYLGIRTDYENEDFKSY